MRIAGFTGLAFWLVALAGCSTVGVMPTATSTTIADPSQFAATDQLVGIADAPPAGATAIGLVEVFACQAHNFDPVPTDGLAVSMLKAEAAKRGARVLVGLRLDRQNVDIAHNCYWTIHATATAYS